MSSKCFHQHSNTHISSEYIPSFANKTTWKQAIEPKYKVFTYTFTITPVTNVWQEITTDCIFIIACLLRVNSSMQALLDEICKAHWINA